MKSELTIPIGYNAGDERPSNPHSSNMHYVKFCVFQYKGMMIIYRAGEPL